MTDANSEERQVGDMLAAYHEAVRAADLERIGSYYEDDIVAYDAIAALEFRGREAFMSHWRMCLEMCEGFVFKPADVEIRAGGDLAYGHYLVECGGAGPDGETHTSWMRASFAARRAGGRWRIAHEHYSLPFDPVTQKILTDLSPAKARAAA